MEVVGADQRTNASDCPSGESAGEPSPITPSGGEVRRRTLPSASRIENSVDLPDSSAAEAKMICAPSGVQASQLVAENASKRTSRNGRSSPPAAGITMISPLLAPCLLTNAIWSPSGDHAGYA